mmetsp:Transcript_2628/g.8819  ORF Transcript_2628/g.8819 Transcript_2628/m.8819 type:complete len:214 (-) Transcript_2628:300-941(-)
MVHRTCLDLLKAVPYKELSSKSAAEVWPLPMGLVFSSFLELRSSASSFLDFWVLCRRVMRIRREAASTRQAMSSILTGSLVGGMATFSPCLYSGAVWLEVPRLRLGQTSSAARAHSSTSSQDLFRTVLAVSIFRRLASLPSLSLSLSLSSFSSSSSMTARAFSAPGSAALSPAWLSRSLAHIRIMAGVRFFSMPSACSSSMCLSLFCIHFAGK